MTEYKSPFFYELRISSEITNRYIRQVQTLGGKSNGSDTTVCNAKCGNAQINKRHALTSYNAKEKDKFPSRLRKHHVWIKK